MTIRPTSGRRPWGQNRRGRDRRGAILILAIVCVAVTMSIMALLVRFALMHHATQKNQHRAAQANWLVESALDRAAARLAIDPSYTGETWNISAEEFFASKQASEQSSETGPPGKAALVRIEVKPVAASLLAYIPLTDSPVEHMIHVTADYPNDPKHRARRSKQIFVTLIAPEPDKPKPDNPEPDNSKQTNGKQPPENGAKP